jgi:hypothetical protein
MGTFENTQNRRRERRRRRAKIVALQGKFSKKVFFPLLLSFGKRIYFVLKSVLAKESRHISFKDIFAYFVKNGSRFKGSGSVVGVE